MNKEEFLTIVNADRANQDLVKLLAERDAQLNAIRAIAELEPHHECQLCNYMRGKLLAVLGEG